MAIATSDGLQQIIVSRKGCLLMFARELKAEVEATNDRIKQEHLEAQEPVRNYLGDALPAESKQRMEDMRKGKGNGNGKLLR